MKLKTILARPAIPLLLLISAVTHGQAPSAIQIFLPNGERPARELRFTLTRDDGRVEIMFTDSKGKFQLTGDLNRDREYTVTVAGDGRSFETTTATVRLLRGSVTYVPIFLREYKDKRSRAAGGVVDAAGFEANVPPLARQHHDRAMRLISQNDPREAIVELTRAIEVYPKYLQALTDLGVVYLKLGNLDEAETILRKAVAANDDFQVAKVNLGIVLNRRGKHAQAAELLTAVYKQIPRPNTVYLPYTEALIGSARPDEAASVLREAIAEGKLETAAAVEAHYKLGVVLTRQEKYAEAITELRIATELDPKAGNAHLVLGGALLQLKRYPEAEKALVQAYELGGSDSPAAQLLLGQLYTLQQKYELAILAFEQYLKDFPAAPNRHNVETSIAKLKAALPKE